MPRRIPKFLDLKPFVEGVSYHAGYGTEQAKTKGFNHLRPANATNLRMVNRQMKLKRSRNNLPLLGPLKIPPPQDRIKQWNIVPGDKVGVRGDEDSSKVWDVAAVDRVLNTVLLTDTSGQAKNLLVRPPEDLGEDKDDTPTGHRAVPYWNCKLLLGYRELPEPHSGEMNNIPFFAKRMRKTPPKYDGYSHSWTWKRYAIAIEPRIPGYKLQSSIPWPKPPPKQHLPRTPKDTPLEVVQQVTYKPPLFSTDLYGPRPLPPPKEDFLFQIMNPHLPKVYHGTQPVEVHLVDELSNPHARAKKIQRWQKTLENRKALLGSLIAEQKRLYRLTDREARAQAIVLWKEKIEQAQKSKKKQLLKMRMEAKGHSKKLKRKAMKAEKTKRKLRELNLAAAPNQYLPPSMVQPKLNV
ncbi:hypothetical protein DL96DRAFT_1593561 [Flagelloscypha sp. PMI_526]|nr:hypothetical protein DL96DRAFT_1593561 [Flagelloscypha sp. PMI_526]